MKSSRGYDMRTRAASAQSTRARIVDAAEELFLARWYDDVTLAGIADLAGVSAQTVLNHFGGKEQVFARGDRARSRPAAPRAPLHAPSRVTSAAAIEALVDDYEITGDATIRLLAVEDRLPAVQRGASTHGRAGHREWVEAMFAAPEVTAELVVVTDVYAWKLLRRDQGLTRDATVAADPPDGRAPAPPPETTTTPHGAPHDLPQALPLRDHRRRRHRARRHVGRSGRSCAAGTTCASSPTACSPRTSSPPAPSTSPGTPRRSARTSGRRAW